MQWKRVGKRDLVKGQKFEEMKAKRNEFISLDKVTIAADFTALKVVIDVEKGGTFDQAIAKFGRHCG